MVLILTYSDVKKLSFTYDEFDSKQKNINLRSSPAANFFLARDRYSYAVMEMQPHIQAAKCHQYEVYRANSFLLVIFLVQSRLSTTRPVITLIGCNAVGRASRFSGR